MRQGLYRGWSAPWQTILQRKLKVRQAVTLSANSAGAYTTTVREGAYTSMELGRLS